MKRAMLILLLLLIILAITACNFDANKPVKTDDVTEKTQTNTAQTTTNKPAQTSSATEHIHSFREWTVIKEATCTDDGTEERSCSCGEKETRVIDAKGHAEVIDMAIEATCTEEGKTEGSHCSVCNTVIKAQETVPAKGHTEVIDAAVSATCIAEGKTEGSHCSVCNVVIKEQETIPLKEHTIVIDYEEYATCTEEGLTEGSHCAVCGITIEEQKTVPARGHTVVIDEAVEATCTEDGKTEGSHCSACGIIIKEQETIAASHNVPHGICLVCNEVFDEEEAIDYYITSIESNASSKLFTTYYNNEVYVQYLLSTMYPNISISNTYNGQIAILFDVGFVTSLTQIGDYFQGTGFLSYTVYCNGSYVYDGTVTINGYGGSLANVFTSVFLSSIEECEFEIVFSDYYM